MGYITYNYNQNAEINAETFAKNCVELLKRRNIAKDYLIGVKEGLRREPMFMYLDAPPDLKGIQVPQVFYEKLLKSLEEYYLKEVNKLDNEITELIESQKLHDFNEVEDKKENLAIKQMEIEAKLHDVRQDIYDKEHKSEIIFKD